MSSRKPYSFCKFDPNVNYLLNFEGKGTDLETGELVRKLEDPYGISGCGLWKFHPFINDGKLDIDYSLVGIMFMAKKGKYHVLVATKIELLIEAITKRYDLRIRPIFDA
jgi:hypothetical protein